MHDAVQAGAASIAWRNRRLCDTGIGLAHRHSGMTAAGTGECCRRMYAHACVHRQGTQLSEALLQTTPCSQLTGFWMNNEALMIAKPYAYEGQTTGPVT